MKSPNLSARQVVIKFMDSYAIQNVENCVNLLVKNQPILFFGTNIDEICKTPEQVKTSLIRDFTYMKDIKWDEATQEALYSNDDMASVLIELPISYSMNDKSQKTMLRYAFTIIKEDGDWRILMAIASAPFAEGSYTF